MSVHRIPQKRLQSTNHYVLELLKQAILTKHILTKRNYKILPKDITFRR